MSTVEERLETITGFIIECRRMLDDSLIKTFVGAGYPPELIIVFPYDRLKHILEELEEAKLARSRLAMREKTK